MAADLAVLAEPDRGYVERLLALATVCNLAQRFSAMVRTRSANALTSWPADADLSDLRSFTAGLRQDD